MEKYDIRKELFEVVELLGITALFTEERLSDDVVPEGLYKYELREGDDDVFYFATIEKRVAVNHVGTILSVKEIDLGPEGYIYFYDRSEDECLGFSGSYMSIAEYTWYISLSTDKKTNVKYWDEIDNFAENYISILANKGFFGKQLDDSDVVQAAKEVTEKAIDVLKKWYDFEFPYVDGDC